MALLQNLFGKRSGPSINLLAERFLQVFDAHNVEVSQIPRLILHIRYEDLQSEGRLLASLTPSVIDTVAELFGVRRQWLEGLDGLIFYPFWHRGNLRGILERVACVAAAAGTDHRPLVGFPLRVLTTSKTLNREATDHQLLLPVIVEPIGGTDDSPAYRCQVSGDIYDWSQTPSRLELKAITWLISHRLNEVVPMFQVSEDELEDIRNGMTIPSTVWRKGLVTSPSLEDFVLSLDESVVAKETDELPAVLSYLDAQGLRDFTFVTHPPAVVIPTQEAAPQDTPSAEPIPTEVKKPSFGKRQTQKVNWSAILTAAQTIWAKPPFISYADMIRRLKSMPHLKAAGQSESAIHKHLRTIAPPEGRGRPGRKPNQSA